MQIQKTTTSQILPKLFASMLIHCVLSNTYLWQNLQNYLTSYYKFLSDARLTYSYTNIVYIICILSRACGIVLGVNFIKKFIFLIANSL